MSTDLKMIDEDCKKHKISFFDLDEEGICMMLDGDDDKLLFANQEQVKKLADMLKKYMK